MTDISISERLCRFVAETPFEALPPATVEAARKVLLDATGVMYAASGFSGDVGPMLELAFQSGDGPCAVLGTGRTASAPFAALANGAMAHALDYEDAFDPVPGHPNASMVPAVLALAQLHGPVDGKTVLTALAVGCDFACRVAVSLNRTMESMGWYPPPIIGALAAAAGSARVLGLDWKQTRDTLSLILCQATMPGEIMFATGSTIRAIREGFPAQTAVQSALLAKAGVTGFAAPMEGKGGFFRLYVDSDYDENVLMDELGERYAGEVLSFKPYPCCRGTHPHVEMISRLSAQHGFGWQDIDQVIALIDPAHVMLCEPLERKQAPTMAIDAKFSLPFTIGLGAVKGGIGLDDFSAETLADPDVLAVAAKVVPTLEDNPRWERGSGGAIRVVLKDGREFEDLVTHALGSPERPMSREDLIEKFVECLSRAEQPKSAEDARSLANDILNVDQCVDTGSLFQ